ncbi:MAG: TolC family protein [Gammaproteobacteria bacterium]|nr:TolC family protein [Gammaproteobacteria bacterium]
MYRRLCYSAALLAFVFPAYADSTYTDLTLEQCIEIALQKSASVQEASANIEEYRARLKEVQANYYPKLNVLTWVAPMFTVQGSALQQTVDRKFDLGSWGPSTHLEALLAMPVYTFGRLEAGENAAEERLKVEQARLRETQNHVKVEVNKFYYSHLYAKTISPHLDDAKKILDEAQVKANEMYENASGKVTKADLMKLEYGQTEIQKYLLMAKQGEVLALAALKHTMGLSDEVNLTLKETSIPKPDRSETLASLEELQQFAREHRPEWEQLDHGKKAAASLRRAEKLSALPVLFVAGTFEHSWTPTRDDTDNPYHFDEYNDMFGGVAMGLKLDFDWALTRAKVDAANAKMLQVNALNQLATTGIPLQIKKAHSDVERYQQQIALSSKARKAANKWIVFSAAAYHSGTGEVKDVLEGLVALLQSKRDYYEGILNYHIASAELDYAIGK